ncbi:PREDICTED: uncharacterized protein LOC104746390 isoform X4 [Camelina sativa]|uniref:Uncharacterized protein LOC104746390 isoform X4 n=1 Tax=Camelina sativa TaxID=90675 RepID=A0ABM0W616_CAMSA|nr:PREDICTED: uncharacterized protein LOC104746390 isoform X4 [Camelina sativa]XP_019094777.1 PREDICTED: uncharacterized protein LOC104746390 isoform X4 [Camelina sativa]
MVASRIAMVSGKKVIVLLLENPQKSFKEGEYDGIFFCSLDNKHKLWKLQELLASMPMSILRILLFSFAMGPVIAYHTKMHTQVSSLLWYIVENSSLWLMVASRIAMKSLKEGEYDGFFFCALDNKHKLWKLQELLASMSMSILRILLFSFAMGPVIAHHTKMHTQVSSLLWYLIFYCNSCISLEFIPLAYGSFMVASRIAMVSEKLERRRI